ncbi:hypothetical protein RirG_147020 [Rhizophagus irregularis DAOM 197198w]|uniref:Uncharacterized protein n=1 Tax=Rhizophagus irregularis (strain DAOM 197198w) TaxID=1432141 RepID=A0A015J3E2_RHIIW|nr:hypothetical protein RirG_147020 [Rhizophagus irregularis DAOM 197198w]
MAHDLVVRDRPIIGDSCFIATNGSWLNIECSSLKSRVLFLKANFISAPAS